MVEIEPEIDESGETAIVPFNVIARVKLAGRNAEERAQVRVKI